MTTTEGAPAADYSQAIPTAPSALLLPFHSDDEWHALRRQDVTASALAGYFGLSRWASEYSEYVEKKGLAQAPRKMAGYVDAGRHLEDGIAKYAEADQGWSICTVAEYLDTRDLRHAGATPRGVLPAIGGYLRDPDARLGATPDRIILSGAEGGEQPLEVKNVSWQAWKAEWENGEAPVKYWLQANTQCGLGRGAGLGWECFTIAALVAGNDLRVLRYPFDAEAFAIAQETARRFWADVEAGREPLADCSDPATQDAVRRRYLYALPETIDLSTSPQALAMAEALVEASARKTAAEKEAKAIQAQLLTLIGHHELALLPKDWTVVAKTQSRGSYTVEPTTFRTVSAKPPKGTKAAKPAASPAIAADAALAQDAAA